MSLKIRNGTYVLGPGGLPQEVGGLQELLQNVKLRLNLPKGSFPYGRELGSGLADMDQTEEHAGERAAALANEALLELPGVRVQKVTFLSEGRIRFTLSTPLGGGTVIYGSL